MTVKCPRCKGVLTLIYWGASEYVHECICGRVVTEKEYAELRKAEHDREIFVDALDDIAARVAAIDDVGDSQ